MTPITDDLVQFPKTFLSTATIHNCTYKKHKDIVNYSLPICRRGVFLQDTFFEYAYDLFDKAVRRIMERWGDMDFVSDLQGDAKFRLSNILSRYRQLRPHILKEEDQAVTVATDNSNKIVMDVYDFVNGDVKVKVVGEREVMVEGRLEHNKRDFAVSSNTFRRRFCLPQDTNMEAISSAMSSDGVLTITAPKSSKHKQHGLEMIIPIKVDGVPQAGVPRPLASPVTPTVSPLNTLGICRVCALNTRDGAGRRVAGTRQARDTLESFIKSKMQQKEEEKLGMMMLKMGTFFSDSFFKDSWQDFQEAVGDVVSRWGDLTSTTDPLTCYRRLRATDLRQENQAVKSSEDEHNYKFVVDVQDFMDKGEISVQFKNPRELVVTGHVEHKASNSMAANNFLHRFVLPGEVDIDAASSVMSADGVLTVTAPKKTTPLVREIVLPVTLEAGVAVDATVRPSEGVRTQPEPRVPSSTPRPARGPELRMTSPTPRTDREPEPRMTSPTPRTDREPEPRVTSPTPSVMSDDSCDSLGQLWTLCPNHLHGVVIEEV